MTDALEISLKVLLFSVPILALLGGGIGWLLARREFPGRETAILLSQLPVVLPPSVLGLYLLLLLARTPGLREAGILFALPAAVIGAIVPALPLMIASARSGFALVDRRLEEAARTLGLSEREIFLRITLPLARRSLAVGLALSSARAMGDFGVTLMIAGNIPGLTQTLPLYIYGRVEAMDFASANVAALLLVAVGVSSLLAARRLESAGRSR